MFFRQLLERTNEWSEKVEPIMRAVKETRDVELTWTRPRFLQVGSGGGYAATDAACGQTFQLVVSHAVAVDGDLLLCPLLSHIQVAQPGDASARVDHIKGALVLRALRPLQAGELLTLPYASWMENWQLMLRHGVVDADNLNEAAAVSTGNAPSLLQELVKTKLLPDSAVMAARPH